MTMPTPEQQPSPALFFETATAFQKSAALKAAVELNLFTLIAEGPGDPEAIAARCNASPRGIRILCECLTACGFLVKNGAGFSLTSDSAVFLDRRSPAYLGSAIDFLMSPGQMDGYTDVAAAVRRGGTALEHQGNMYPDNVEWVKFARGMAPMMMPAAQSIASLLKNGPQPRKVLDIAAGHGVFGVEVGKQHPEAHVVALDWAPVLEVAKENAARAGLHGRYSTLPGDAFEVDFGSGYDTVLLTNFLHHFDPSTCLRLLRKVHAALAPGGRVVTLEFVPNEDRVSPPMPATFSLVMLVSTPAGQAYTFSAYEEMFTEAGFIRNELHPLPGAESVIVSSRE